MSDSQTTEAPITDAEVELAAMELWHRFAPGHHTAWADETHRAEYIDAAKAVIAAWKDVTNA